MDLSTSVYGGAISNFVFVCVFAVGAFIKNRLDKSRCELNCGILNCQSSISELEKIDAKLTTTQRDQHNILNEIITHLRIDKQGEESIRIEIAQVD